MLLRDRVICDRCNCDMGQLHNRPAPQPDVLEDHNEPPFFAVCPNCRADEKEVA